MSDKLTQLPADNAAATPANAVLVIPPTLTRPQRHALALQPQSPTVATVIAPDLDLSLLPFLPDDLQATVQPADNAKLDNRAWLTVQPAIVEDADHTKRVDFGTPPDGLSAVECVLWPSLGRACARGASFLYHWLKVRRYMRACELSGLQSSEIGLLKHASTVFAYLYERCDSAIRTTHHAQAEDTLHALANGEIRKVKTVTDPSGDVTTTDEGAIYDTKALALQLAAGDRNRYGQGATGAAAPVIQLNISIPRPDAIDIAPAVSVKPATEAEPQDIDYIEP